jgi:hypothetical protein
MEKTAGLIKTLMAALDMLSIRSLIPAYNLIMNAAQGCDVAADMPLLDPR